MNTDDVDDDSAYFGIWPSIVGFAFGIAIVVFMFSMATGMR